MEMLVAKCSACQASLKYSKDKGGKKTKCPKCGAEMTLPKDQDSKAQPPGGNPDDDDAGGYGLATTNDEADKKQREEAQATKKPVDKKPKPRIKIRRKNIGDLDSWRKVNAGFLFFMIGACTWGGAFGMHALVIFFGLIQGPEYGPNAEKFLMPEGQVIAPGEAPNLDRATFFLSLISGTAMVGTARALMIVGQILMLVTSAMWMTGYGLCLAVENRMGTKGQLITMFCLSAANLLLNVFLWLLPIVGAIRYVLVPYFAPEIVTSEVNVERVVPLHTHWCALPTLEVILALVVYMINLLEPIMIGVFIWTVAHMLRDEPRAEKALGLIKMGFGVLFMILAFHVYAVAGSSSVLIKLLRVIYLLWFSFQIGMIVWLATTCAAARDMMNFYLNPND